MKIYTKTGDKGKTSLVGGERVPKNHLRIETSGAIDELIAHIGIIRGYDLPDKKYNTSFLAIQDALMYCCALVSSPNYQQESKRLKISTKELEKSIDQMETRLPALKNFLLPGGHLVSGHCHLARTVCRRAERLCVSTSETIGLSPDVLPYLNRLSDFLFQISRSLSYDYHVDEILWKPNAS